MGGEKRSPENLRSGGKGPWRRENVVGKWDRRLEREREEKEKERKREKEREARHAASGKGRKGNEMFGGWVE